MESFVVRGEGPPLLMIHGADGDHRMFGALTDLLAPHFTCIGYDQRDSGGHVAPDAPYTVDDLADDAAAVIQAAGFDRAHVYGTSFGGQVAQNLAVRHAHRVDGLVLGNTWRSGLRLADINPNVANVLDALRADRAANALQIAAYFHPAAFLEAHPAVVAGFARTTRDVAQQARRRALMEHVTGVDPGSIAARTIIVAGQFDRLVAPRTTFELLEHIPGSYATMLRGAGHVPCIHQAGALADVMRTFLRPQPD